MPINSIKKQSCVYCGNNPVPHFIYWYFESVNILLTPIRQLILRFFSFINLDLGLPLVALGKAFKIIAENNDITKCKSERAKVLWEEASKRGIVMKELLLFGKPFDVYLAEKFKVNNLKSKIVFSGLPRPKNINEAALDLMDDKAILKKKFILAGLPVAEGGSVWNFSEAKNIFKKVNANKENQFVIVKPRVGSRGRHSTTFVKTFDNLKRAYQVAKKLCFWVVVEEQLFGPVYRATVINYELCGVLRGDSPEVIGDGLSSIKQLIDIKNQQAHPGVQDIKVDLDTERFLARQNKNFLSILKKGEVVALSEKIGVNYGGSSSEDFKICHTDNRELFEKAAKIVADPIVGFDFIIPDIARSWKEQKCGFLEANSLPFINLHHNPLLGTPRNVAAKIWDIAEESF